MGNLEEKNIYKLRGIFNLVVKDKDNNVISMYEEENLIMDKAHITMSNFIGGMTSGAGPINTFILGNKGHVSSNVLIAKKVDENGFTSDRTNLFSMDPAFDNENQTPSFFYSIKFNTEDANLTTKTDGKAIGYINGTLADSDPNIVTKEINNNEVTYTIEIPLSNGNNPDSNSLAAYTECALFSGDTEIFSMKTFPVKVKTNEVKYTITYKLIF